MKLVRDSLFLMTNQLRYKLLQTLLKVGICSSFCNLYSNLSRNNFEGYKGILQLVTLMFSAKCHVTALPDMLCTAGEHCTVFWRLLWSAENLIFLLGTSLLPAMKVREDWILGVVVEHPNLPTIATAQSRLCPSHFVEVIFYDWNSNFAEFFKIDLP